jgi:hypothetical protein
VGTYLIPRLIEAGYELFNISRARREPYQAHGAWRSVQQVSADREAEDAQGAFGQRVRDLSSGSQPHHQMVLLPDYSGIRFGPPLHRFDFSYEHIISSVEGSLRRLQTDYVDVLLPNLTSR